MIFYEEKNKNKFENFLKFFKNFLKSAILKWPVMRKYGYQTKEEKILRTMAEK